MWNKFNNLPKITKLYIFKLIYLLLEMNIAYFNTGCLLCNSNSFKPIINKYIYTNIINTQKPGGVLVSRD